MPSRVTLPAQVPDAFTVYRNGVPQRAGEHFTREGRALVFPDQLKEDRVSLWRWAVGAIGVGTYRQDDSVDVRYVDAAGRPTVAERLPIVAEDPA